MQKSLQTSEWILVGTLLILLASFAMITRFHEHRKASQLRNFSFAVEKPYSISIQGAVAKPGIFSAPPGCCLGEILKKSRPKRFANLREIDLSMQIEADMQLHVPELTSLKICLQGAGMESVELEVPVGTRVSDLKSKIQPSSFELKKVLKSRRLLKDGDLIEIPSVANE